MKRNRFLSLLGMSFFATVFSSAKKVTDVAEQTGCNLPITPPVPEGPYYKKENLNRVNISENKTGTPIEYVFKVEDKNCKPIKNAIIDIWHCDANGHYSDFKQENTLNETWLRGFQYTDENGECRFTSIFPGWYDNRITHLHAKVLVENKEVLTTNFFYPKEIEDDVFKSPLYPKGLNPLSVLQDVELKVDKDTSRHDKLVMNIVKKANGSLLANYTIAIV